VDAHEGTRIDFLRGHEAEARRAATMTGAERDHFCRQLLHRAIDSRNLLLAYEHILREGGPARGTDGIGPRDLEQRDATQLVREIRRAVLAGDYRPGPVETFQKKKKIGTRPISILTIADRVLERAIVQVLQPFIDPLFDSNTLGGRPRRSLAEMFARADHYTTTENRWWWLTCDVKKAFDSIPHDPLISIVRLHLGATAITDLIEQIVRSRGAVGVVQGGALSMLLLNMYLDATLDKPLTAKFPGIPCLRWVDDVGIPCKTEEEAETIRNAIETMLQEAGLTLKQDPPPTIKNLKTGQEIDWLGLRLKKEGDTLHKTINEDAWAALEDALQEALTDNPDEAAKHITAGWLNALGPCYPHTDITAIHNRTAAITTKLGLEAMTEPKLSHIMEKAYQRYCLKKTSLMAETTDEADTTRDTSQTAAAPPARTLASIVPHEAGLTCQPSSTEGTTDFRPRTSRRRPHPFATQDLRFPASCGKLNKTPVDHALNVQRIDRSASCRTARARAPPSRLLT